MKCLLMVGREYLHHHQVVEAIYGSFLQQLPLLDGRPYGTQEAGGAPLPPRPVAHRGRRPAALSAGERRYPMCKEVTFVYLVVDRLGPCGKNEAARFDNWSDALAFVEKAEQAGLPWAQDLEIIDVTDNDTLAI